MQVLQQRSAKPAWGVRAAWLLLALAAALYCGWRFAGPSPLQTNLLALLPATEADPVAEKAVDTLASALGDRTVFLVTSNDAAHAKAAAKQLGAALSAEWSVRLGDGGVAAVRFVADRGAVHAVSIRFACAGRSRSACAEQCTVSVARHTRATPLQPAARRPDDATRRRSFRLARTLAWRFAARHLESRTRRQLAGVASGAATSVLVDRHVAGFGLRIEDAARGARSVAHGEGASQAGVSPMSSVARTGAVFYAEAARSASEHEVHLIGIASLCGIALLMLWVFRSPRLILLGFVSTALGIVCALAVTMLDIRQAASVDARVRREPDRRGGRLFDPVFRGLSRCRARLGFTARRACRTTGVDGRDCDELARLRDPHVGAVPRAQADCLFCDCGDLYSVCVGAVAVARVARPCAQAQPAARIRRGGTSAGAGVA